MSSLRADTRSGAAPDAGFALAATLLLLAFHAVRGFPTLADSGGDNDSVLRLVQVRDLLAGQGWFDLTQYRMGLEDGLAMHWSRLVDLPVALLAATLSETAALVIWPLLLFWVCLFAIARAARQLGGDEAALPAIVLGGLALYFVNVFPPGALDHHNLQLALALGALLFLMRGSPGWAFAAGACAALMLAVGMEAAPYAAVACAVAAVSFLAGGEANTRLARGFGIGFSATCLAALAATTPFAGWFAAHCDAFSLPQVALGVLGGAGLALAASLPSAGRSGAARLTALGAVGAACAALLLLVFPQCLADPYAGLDPRLRRYWLEAVSEAQSFTAILRSDPARLVTYYATPFLALGLLGWGMARGIRSRDRAIVAAFLLAAVLVSLWQVRGSTFAIPLATIPLAAWIAAARRNAEGGLLGAQLAMAGAWLVSVNLVWQLAAGALAAPATEAAGGKEAAAACYAHADYAALAGLPEGTVAGISNLGSSILANTPHRALAGPYHRNEAGNLANLDVLMGEPAQARVAAMRAGVDYLVVCRGNPETAAITGWAPGGALALLVAGQAPGWLSRVPDANGSPLEIWRVTGEH